MSLLYFTSFQSEAAPAELNIASLNMWSWGEKLEDRLDKMKPLFIEEKALEGVSALFLQEAIVQDKTNSVEMLARRLDWQNYFQKRRGDSEGLGIILPQTTQVLSQSKLDVKAKYNAADYNRIVVSLQIRDPQWGRVRLVNLHLAHEPFMAKTRKDQLQEIIDWTKGLEDKEASRYVIFGGDFNTGPQESFYERELDLLLALPFLSSLAPVSGSNFSWTDFESGEKELVDYFLLSQSPSWRTQLSTGTRIDSRFTERRLSDHNLAKLRIVEDKEVAN